MSTSAAFVTSKQPYGTRTDGDIELTRVLVAALADVCERVTVVALSDDPVVAEPPVEVIEVPKPAVAWSALIRDSVRHRRSLIHTRFAPPQLVDRLRSLDADLFLARRTYMAQALVDARPLTPYDRFYVIVDALESTVLSRRRSPLSPLLRHEARRTRSDELVCLRASSGFAYLSDSEAEDLEDELPPAPRLDIVLPPTERAESLTQPRALFVGDRRWAPNADGLQQLLRLWPQIHASVPGSRLRVIGRQAPRERFDLPAGVELEGYVSDIDREWESAGVLLAPVRIGGGVRMKVLDAASRGVPVIGTPAAIGSVDRFLPVQSYALDAPFVEAAVGLLSDRERRQREGAELHGAVRAHHESGLLQRQLRELLRLDAGSGS